MMSFEWAEPVAMELVCKNEQTFRIEPTGNSVTVVSGYKPWVRSAWQRDNMGSGTQNGVFAS